MSLQLIREHVRRKLEEIQDHYIAKPAANVNASIDDDEEDNMVLAAISEEKIVVCDFEKAILIAIK